MDRTKGGCSSDPPPHLGAVARGNRANTPCLDQTQQTTSERARYAPRLLSGNSVLLSLRGVWYAPCGESTQRVALCRLRHPPIRENIPERYLFNNNSEISFINCLNQAYDTPGLPDCPIFPDWATVAQRCIHALTGGSPVS